MSYKEEYLRWINEENILDEVKEELKNLSEKEIEDRFYKDLEFGTGGLRGVMNYGTNRMNIYTIRKATQGLAMEINDVSGANEKGVVIAYDSRNNSRNFAFETAKVLCANGIKTYIFDSLRPTPELSFAVRYLKCYRGIVITASHNPKEYNGYKVYGEDGSQISPDVADKIIKYISKIDIFNGVKTTDEANYKIVGKEVDDAYYNAISEQSFDVKIPSDFKVVYSPLHGSGNIPVREIVKRVGVENLFVVPEQELPDGNFPTVISPNPENAEAFTIAIKYAKEQNADLIFGTDPDSDRIGVVVRNSKGEYEVLTGNQTGALLCEFILRKSKENGTLPTDATVIKTIVTTEFVRAIADDYGAEVIDVLTGFKFIGEKIKEFEAENNAKKYMFGLEESYGYLRGTYARDKDAVVAAMLIVQMAAEYKNNGITLYDALINLYEKYGYYKEALVNKTLKGIEGMNKINAIMNDFRVKDLPFKVNKKIDYKDGVDGLPKSNVLKFFVDDGWFAVRPSGTEPKIKFYFGIKSDSLDKTNSMLEEFKNKVMSLVD